MNYYFVVVGCGSIGRRHIKILKQSGIRVAGVDTHQGLLERVQGEEKISVFNNLDEALESSPDAVFICTPPSFHVPLALQVVRSDIPIFIEKPLSHSAEGLKDLAHEVRERNLVTQVGCNLRFMKSLKRVKELIEAGTIGNVLSVRAQCGFYLPYWRPHNDYRNSYSARKELGGGVLLDNIHEIDFLIWLFGMPKDVFCRAQKVSSLDINVEDLVEISLSFPNNLLAQVHLDYLQRTYRRSCEFLGETGSISWDYIRKEIKHYSVRHNEWTVFTEDINTELNQMYLDQLEHFLKCLRREEKPCNDVDRACLTLQVVLKCYESARSQHLEHL